MKIVIAPNAFKGSLTAGQAARAMADGVLSVCPGAEVILRPVADGGDGLLDILSGPLQGSLCPVRVRDPLGRAINARYLQVRTESFAVIETAQASGLSLLKSGERNPAETTTHGSGELLLHALRWGAKRIMVGLGGSATCDGGTGLASVLGYRFLDPQGRAFEPQGDTLAAIDRIDPRFREPLLAKAGIEAACDVENPLLGPEGTARVFAPQKGATPEQVSRLEEGLENLAERIRWDLGIEVHSLPGTGAAGGLGAGLLAFTHAVLVRGVDRVLDLIGFDEALDGASLVITGEGCLDHSTLSGKAPAGVADRAMLKGIPCLAAAGRIEGDPQRLKAAGFARVKSMADMAGPDQPLMEQATAWLRKATASCIDTFLNK
ncbi:MAG: glycerate kinase [Planctomycetes bacterium]|nr:glycerate kinase [Planctomycetota bacterium]